MNKFLKEFKDRGYFYQCTSEDELSKLLDKESIKAYIGFDCTASKVYTLVVCLQIMCLKAITKTWTSTNCSSWWRNNSNRRSIWKR